MTLADIQNHIYRRVKTNSTDFPVADQVIAINNALERVESIIRQWVSNYVFTRFTASDVNTGTASPKLNSLFHELVPLWVEWQYAAENGLSIKADIAEEIRTKEDEMKRFYGMRNYKIFTVTIASPGVFTLDNHRILSGQRVIFETSGALPTGLSAETWYYVITDGLTQHTFRVASTRDGTAINTSGTQSGSHFVSIERRAGIRASDEDTR